MDWELVCEKKELEATAQAIFMTGVSLGNVIRVFDISIRHIDKPI